MLEINRILCPVDLSEHSRRALQYATATARWYGSQLTVLYVMRYMPAIDLVPLFAADTTERVWVDDLERQQLTEAAQRFVADTTAGRVQAELVVKDAAQVHREIVARASALQADLVIMGAHGRSGYERLLLGSTTEKVLRSSPVPVMIVPSRADAAVPAGDVGFDSIIAAVDFSEASLRAVGYAMSLAQEADAYLTLVNVIDAPEEHDEDRDALAASLALAREAARASRASRLRALVPESVQTFCRVEIVVEAGKPYREILRIADEKKSDLIVMGIHGRGPVDRMLFGSNTNHVVRAASCPVLAVPHR
jgi:nucleotide-binding universal stress UspA family protein